MRLFTFHTWLLLKEASARRFLENVLQKHLLKRPTRHDRFSLIRRSPDVRTWVILFNYLNGRIWCWCGCIWCSEALWTRWTCCEAKPVYFASWTHLNSANAARRSGRKVFPDVPDTHQATNTSTWSLRQARWELLIAAGFRRWASRRTDLVQKMECAWKSFQKAPKKPKLGNLVLDSCSHGPGIFCGGGDSDGNLNWVVVVLSKVSNGLLTRTAFEVMFLMASLKFPLKSV